MSIFSKGLYAAFTQKAGSASKGLPVSKSRPARNKNRLFAETRLVKGALIIPGDANIRQQATAFISKQAGQVGIAYVIFTFFPLFFTLIFSPNTLIS